MKSSLLALSVALSVGLAGCATTYATPVAPLSTVPLEVGVQTTPFQAKPESLAHWKQLAQDMATEAAPQLRGITVSSSASGLSSPFDVAFHDFFVSALHQQGVDVATYGAPVEIDTYPLAFPSHPFVIENASGHVGTAPSLEFGVTVRVFNHGYLAFSSSKTYYLPQGDYPNYTAFPKPAPAPVDPHLIEIVGE